MSIMNRSPTGMELASGTSSHLQNLGFATLEEFVLPTHDLRVDVIALGRKGELWIVECKSSVRDFTSDSKWHRYIAYCDRFFFSVGHEFPTSILPDGTGIIISDGFDAEILSSGSINSMQPARRKKLVIEFGRSAASRLSRSQQF